MSFKKSGTESVISARFDSSSASSGKKSYIFLNAVNVVTAQELEEVLPAIKQVEELVAKGCHAAGFICYEAAAAFNPHLPKSRFTTLLPLLWFGIFSEKIEDFQESATASYLDPPVGEIRLSTDLSSFSNDVERIKKHIEHGETYQVNHTVRGFLDYRGDPEQLYHYLKSNQNSDYSSFISTPDFQIISASPELFFSISGGNIKMKPMKGTASRQADEKSDAASAESLKNSPKERAENLMIVDLIRNDLALISETGGVNVTSLFDIERYPTLHQMTSTVTARLKKGISITDVFSALFPCGSVTGAPKRKTMEIIDSLEDSAREVYCGAIGFISPSGEATFSVGIRTLFSTKGTGYTLGIGSGITYDSDPSAEYSEVLLKAAFLTAPIVNNFSLIETIRHDSDGYFLLEEHLKRLQTSASHFNFKCNIQDIRQTLAEISQKLNKSTYKVRILLKASGEFTTAFERLDDIDSSEILKTAVCENRIDKSNKFLYHKTTNRNFYENERNRYPEFYDLIFQNLNGELTEGSFNNIVIRLDGKLVTPPVECGLLNGVMRQKLLDSGVIEEKVIKVDELLKAEKIFFINSVRKWRECRIK